MFISLGRRVIKFIFLLFSYGCLLLKAQAPAIDLEQKSMVLLKSKVNYTTTKPSLKETLKNLSFENNINILFSSTTLGDTKASPVQGGKMELGLLLPQLLKGTGFDYVVVGQSIAIIKDEKKPIAPDTAKTKAVENTHLHIHIVSEKTQSFEHIPKKDRRIVRALLLKELHSYGLELEENSDTIIVKPIENNIHYGIAVMGGLMANKVHTRSITTYDWETELRYQQKNFSSLTLSIHGIVYKKACFGFVGLAFNNLKSEIAWAEMKKNGAQIELPSTSKAEKIKYLNATDRFVIISIPIGVGYTFKVHRDHSLAPMLSLDVFAVSNAQNNNLSKFKEYYKVKNPQEKYEEKVHRLGLSNTLSLRYSYAYKKPIALIADIGYRIGLSPYMSNSVFKSSYRSFLLTVGINIYPIK